MRALIEEVLASFPPRNERNDASRSAGDAGALERLRELFIAAGVERMERECDAERWLQIGVSFRGAGQADAFLRDELRPAITRWLAEKRFERFFFMRKAPGLRLRFEGRALETELWPALREIVERGEREGTVRGHEFGVYDAETYQFGGETGLHIAHEFFHHDSLALMDLLAAEREDGEATDRSILSLLVLNDLFRRCVDDGPEHWDVWCNMDLAGRTLNRDREVLQHARKALAANRKTLTLTTGDPSLLLEQLAPAERKAMQRLIDSNESVANRLRQAAREGKLLYGVRKILPFFVIFHWNRWSMGIGEQCVLSYYMQEILNGKSAPVRAGLGKTDRRKTSRMAKKPAKKSSTKRKTKSKRS
jgi:thiopeptide-type bacteriocin biosynthesis protein